jgi:hypothetical protein
MTCVPVVTDNCAGQGLFLRESLLILLPMER